MVVPPRSRHVGTANSIEIICDESRIEILLFQIIYNVFNILHCFETVLAQICIQHYRLVILHYYWIKICSKRLAPAGTIWYVRWVLPCQQANQSRVTREFSATSLTWKRRASIGASNRNCAKPGSSPSWLEPLQVSRMTKANHKPHIWPCFSNNSRRVPRGSQKNIEKHGTCVNLGAPDQGSTKIIGSTAWQSQFCRRITIVTVESSSPGRWSNQSWSHSPWRRFRLPKRQACFRTAVMCFTRAWIFKQAPPAHFVQYLLPIKWDPLSK